MTVRAKACNNIGFFVVKMGFIQKNYGGISVMSSNAVKRLSFALSTAAKNLVFEALSGNSKAASFICLSASSSIFLAFCFRSFNPTPIVFHIILK